MLHAANIKPDLYKIKYNYASFLMSKDDEYSKITNEVLLANFLIDQIIFNSIYSLFTMDSNNSEEYLKKELISKKIDSYLSIVKSSYNQGKISTGEITELIGNLRDIDNEDNEYFKKLKDITKDILETEFDDTNSNTRKLIDIIYLK